MFYFWIKCLCVSTVYTLPVMQVLLGTANPVLSSVSQNDLNIATTPLIGTSGERYITQKLGKEFKSPHCQDRIGVLYTGSCEVQKFHQVLIAIIKK